MTEFFLGYALPFTCYRGPEMLEQIEHLGQPTAIVHNQYPSSHSPWWISVMDNDGKEFIYSSNLPTFPSIKSYLPNETIDLLRLLCHNRHLSKVQINWLIFSYFDSDRTECLAEVTGHKPDTYVSYWNIWI